MFFAQRLDEALFDYTAEKYKPSVLYATNSCYEVIETISQVKEGIWPIKTLETVYDEFKHIYKKDEIAKLLVGDIDSYYLTNIDEKNLENLKANLELLYFKIRPVNYLEKVKEQLLIELNGAQRSIEIEKLTLRFISALTHIGYSQEFIYFESNNFFFKTTKIDNTEMINHFFKIFNLQAYKFDVYLKANQLFDKVKDACSRFKTEIKTAAERLDLMLRKFDLHKESFFRFNRSIDFHGTAIDNKYPENQLLQNWIALETLIVENKDDSKINQLISALVPTLNFEYIKRIFVELSADIERLKNKKVIEIIKEVDVDGELYEKLAALTTAKRYLPLAQRIFAECSDFPLLNYRIFWLNKNMSDSEKVLKFIKNHTQRVEWHIRRIYRARNLIVHTGQVPHSIERLVESSHSYLDDMINIIMNLSINGRQIRTIDHGIREIKIRNKMHLDRIAGLADVECTSENFKTILWGEK